MRLISSKIFFVTVHLLLGKTRERNGLLFGMKKIINTKAVTNLSKNIIW